MAIRDQFLRKQLPGEQTEAPDASNTADIHETAQPYQRWVPGIRSFLRLRYLSAKKSVLLENKQEMRYDISTADIQHRVRSKLNARSEIWPTLLSPWIVAPLLLLLLAGIAYGTWHSYKSALERSVFKTCLLYTSDAADE